MYYSCPYCSSNKKPKLINYFPPIAAKCLDCGHMNLETKFIKDEEQHPNISLNFSQ